MRFLNLCATLAIGLISPSIAQKPGDWADIPSGSWGVIRPRNFNGDYSCLDKRGYLTESDCAVFVANNGHFHLGVDSSAWLSFDQRDKRSLTVSGSPTAGVWKANKINELAFFTSAGDLVPKRGPTFVLYTTDGLVGGLDWADTADFPSRLRFEKLSDVPIELLDLAPEA